MLDKFKISNSRNQPGPLALRAASEAASKTAPPRVQVRFSFPTKGGCQKTFARQDGFWSHAAMAQRQPKEGKQ